MFIAWAPRYINETVEVVLAPQTPLITHLHKEHLLIFFYCRVFLLESTARMAVQVDVVVARFVTPRGAAL